MSRSTANVSFYCRESKKNKDGLAPIEMVIILNTRRCFIQLPRKEDPEKFRAQTSGKKRTDLIEYLDGIRVRLNEIATSFLMEGQPLTADALKAYFKTGGYVVYTIEDLFNDYMHILSKRVGKDQAADYMWAKGEHQEAAEYLKQEIDGTGEVVGAPDPTVNFQENDGLMITGHICALDCGRRATQMSLISLAQETSSGLLETSNFSSSFFLYQRMVSLLRERASAI